MRRTEVLDVLVGQLREMDVELPDAISEATSFVSDCKMDSLDLAEFIARMEQVFRVEVQDNEWKALNTMGRVIDYVLERNRT